MLGLSGLFGEDPVNKTEIVYKFSNKLSTPDLVMVSSPTSANNLMAHYIWQSSIVLSDLISGNKEDCEFSAYLHRKNVNKISIIELGAGAGLPSFVCDRLHAKRVVCTDYPNEVVLKNLYENCKCNSTSRSLIITSHKWGDDCKTLLLLNGNCKFDCIIACDTLWQTGGHDDLLKSCVNLIASDGILVLAYLNHDLGKEQEGKIATQFLTKAACYFTTLYEQSFPLTNTDYGDVHVKILKKNNNNVS